MARFKAEDFVLQIATTAGGSTYNEVTSVTECSSNNAVAMTDISTKGSSGWREGAVYGQKTVDISFSGVVDDDSNTTLLIDAEGQLWNCKLVSGEGTTYTGQFHVSIERQGGITDAETYSGTLTSSGTITRA